VILRPPKPMLATPVSALPTGTSWDYEVKWDGYRTIAVKNAERVTLYSRNLKDVTKVYAPIARALTNLSMQSAILDGELVALDANGRPSFQALHHQEAHALAYYVFDLLHDGRRDLIGEPLQVRRAALNKVGLSAPIFRSEPLVGEPSRIEEAVQQLGLEGIVAKRRESRYEPGRRSNAWVKVRFNKRQEFVIGGFNDDNDWVDSLVVGYYDGKRLVSAGKVRAGLNPVMRRELYRKLLPLRSKTCPFANLPNARSSHWGEGITAEQMLEIVWLKPQVVAEIAFTEWTRDGSLRHARFVSLRTDKDPRDVRRDT
jgi:bifunctional non-homologous end joining protein LigD